jgi:hypothetical protein
MELFVGFFISPEVKVNSGQPQEAWHVPEGFGAGQHLHI